MTNDKNKKNKENDLPPVGTDWRRDEVTKFGRQMMSTCAPCDICQAQVCGEDCNIIHYAFHTNLENRLLSLEEKTKDKP